MRKNLDKQEVHIRQKGITGGVCLVSLASIILLIAVTISFADTVKSLNNLESIGFYNSSAMAKAVFIFLFEFLGILIFWGVSIYVLNIVNSNRRILKDTIEVLNQAEVINNGLNSMCGEPSADEFVSEEFQELDLDIYCPCGCQLFKDDKVCPNCGKETHFKDN